MQDIDIVFFDMDHTIIDNDCDVSWKEFLVEIGLAPEDERIEAQRHWEEYRAGHLDEKRFLSFQLRQFVGKTPEEMRVLAERHFRERVRPRIYPAARRAVQEARDASIPAVILSATNRVIVEPVAAAFGMTDAVCTELERHNGVFTGRIVPPYCFGEGKAFRARAYCEKLGFSLERAACYGDSMADAPVLREAGHPVAVNPAEALESLARREGWKIERWLLE